MHETFSPGGRVRDQGAVQRQAPALHIKHPGVNNQAKPLVFRVDRTPDTSVRFARI